MLFLHYINNVKYLSLKLIWYVKIEQNLIVVYPLIKKNNKWRKTIAKDGAGCLFNQSKTVGVYDRVRDIISFYFNEFFINYVT